MTAIQFYEEKHGGCLFLGKEHITQLMEEYHNQKLVEEIPTLIRGIENNYSEQRKPIQDSTFIKQHPSS